MPANEPGALWLPNSNFFAGRNGHKPLWIILHGTAGGLKAQDTAEWFQNPQAAVSSHYIIGRDGTIVQCVDEADGAWANGILSDGHSTFWDTLAGVNPNNVTISIEHVKPSTDNSDLLTPAQQAASFALIEHICTRWNIPIRAADEHGGITGHFSLDPINRAQCPGAYPWLDLWKFLEEEEMKIIELTDVARFFVQSTGNVWKCPTTNHVIGNAMLDFYRGYGGNALCGLTYLGLPVTDEMPVAPSGIVKQHFERGVLIYDPKRVIDQPPGASGPVYLLKLYSGPGQDPRLSTTAQEAKILQLTSRLQEIEQEANKIASLTKI